MYIVRYVNFDEFIRIYQLSVSFFIHFSFHSFSSLFPKAFELGKAVLSMIFFVSRTLSIGLNEFHAIEREKQKKIKTNELDK